MLTICRTVQHFVIFTDQVRSTVEGGGNVLLVSVILFVGGVGGGVDRTWTMSHLTQMPPPRSQLSW